MAKPDFGVIDKFDAGLLASNLRHFLADRSLQDAVDMGLILKYESQACHRNLRSNRFFRIRTSCRGLDCSEAIPLDQLGVVPQLSCWKMFGIDPSPGAFF